MFHKKRKKSGYGRYIVRGFLLLAFIYSCFCGISSVFKNNDFFTIKNIKISGNVHLETLFLENLADDFSGKNLFDVNKNDVCLMYENISRIKSLKVKKKFPSTLKIEIAERVPAFYINTNEGILVPFDSDFVVLDYSCLYSDEDIPIIKADSISMNDLVCGETFEDDFVFKAVKMHKEITEIVSKNYKNENFKISEYCVIDGYFTFIESEHGVAVMPVTACLEDVMKMVFWYKNYKGFHHGIALYAGAKDQLAVRGE